MPTKNIGLSIIIPAYNEEKKIKRDIIEAFHYFKKNKLAGEIIISTDGVTDSTNDIVRKFQNKYSNLYLIAYKNKIGKGMAIKKGFMRAKGKHIMFADAGYCVPFSYINQGIKKINEGYDCALASRALSRSKIKRKQPLYRRLGSKLFGVIVRNIIGVPKNIKDTQCGFKIYKKTAGKKLFNLLKTKGFMADIELILRAKKLSLKMTQFPVEWKNDSDTKYDPIKGSITNLRDLFLIKFKYKL